MEQEKGLHAMRKDECLLYKDLGARTHRPGQVAQQADGQGGKSWVAPQRGISQNNSLKTCNSAHRVMESTSYPCTWAGL